jgi:hypothetical protein
MKRFLLGILGVTLVFGLVLTGCEGGTADPLSSEAALSSIKVNGVEATLGIPAETWSAVTAGLVGLPQDKLANARVEVKPTGDGAKIYYVACKAGQLPEFVEASTFTFDYGDSLYVEVFSANHDKVLFYQVEVAEAVALINDITVDGRSASGGVELSGIPIPKFGNGVGKPGTSLEDTALEAGEVWYGTSREGSEVALTVTPKFASTKYQVASGSETTAPAFVDATDSDKVTLTSGNFVYVHTTGEGGTQDAYYKIKLTPKDDNTTLATVTINGQTMTLGQKGTHSFPGAEAYGNYSNGAELDTNGGSSYTATALSDLNSVTITATAGSDKATVTYGHATDERNYLIEYGASGALGKLKADEYIAVEVTSELGDKGWYKFNAPLSALSALSVGSVAVTPVKYAVRNGTFGINVTGNPPVVLVPPAEFGSLAFNITKGAGFENATIEYAVRASGLPAANAWSTTLPTIADGTGIMIRITDTANIGGAPSYEGYQYFGVVVAKDGPPEISTLGIGAQFSMQTYTWVPLITAPSLGTPNSDISQVVAGSLTAKPAQIPTAGMPIMGTAGNGVALTYAKTTGTAPADSAFVASVAAGYGAPTPNYNFADGDVIWVKAVRGEYTNYYKVNVTVLDVNGPILTELLIQGDFNGETYTYGYTATVNTGKPAATLEGITTPGSVTLATAKVASNTDGLFLVGTDDDSANSVYYTKTTGAAPSEDAEWVVETPMDFFGMTIYIPPAMAGFANGDVLWARITDETNTTYYKIVVTVE